MKTQAIIFLLFLTIFYPMAAQKAAREAMQRYRYQEAIQLIEKQPETVENAMLKAECYEKLYNYSSAISAYEKALAQDSTYLPAIIALADCEYQSGNADASLKYWKSANRLSPDNLFLQTKKALAHYRANDWKGTIAAANIVFKSDSVPMLLRMVGDAYLYASDTDSAIWYYAKTIEKNPPDYTAVSKLGNIYHAAKYYEEAISVTDNYLTQVNPNQKTIGQLNGMANYAAGNYKKAIERLKENISRLVRLSQ